MERVGNASARRDVVQQPLWQPLQPLPETRLSADMNLHAVTYTLCAVRDFLLYHVCVCICMSRARAHTHYNFACRLIYPRR